MQRECGLSQLLGYFVRLGTFGFGGPLGRRAIIDLPTVAIAGAAFLVLWRARLVPEPVVILAAGALGFLLRKP